MNLSSARAKHELPRERLLRFGPASLRDAELLAIALRTGTPGCNVVELGDRLIQHFGGLRGVLAASMEDLQAIHGLGRAKACTLIAVLELARRGVEEGMMQRRAMREPEQVKEYCRTALGHHPIEHCLALYLDNQLNLIATAEVSRGTLTQSSVYPRELVREALRHHAAALILAHNHPSGQPLPSASDLALTKHLRQALALVDVRLVDHFIVAGNVVTSMAELGQI